MDATRRWLSATSAAGYESETNRQDVLVSSECDDNGDGCKKLLCCATPSPLVL